MFMMNLPYLAPLCMNAVIYFHAFFVSNDINMSAAKIEIRDYDVLKTLGQIGTIIADKSSFIDATSSYVLCMKIDN